MKKLAGRGMMLDDIAVKLFSLSEIQLGLVGLLAGIAGFVAGVVLRWRATTKMRRAPYFATTALISATGSFLPVAWLFVLQASAAGVLWLIPAFVFGGVVALGFCYGAVALSRSRDAYGSGWGALMAVIPFANFILLFKRSKSDANGDADLYRMTFFSGSTGVVVGILLFVGGSVASKLIDYKIDDVSDAPGVDEISGSVELLLRARGLEGALAVMAENADAPTEIDETTTLSRIESDGRTLRRFYVVKDVEFAVDSFMEEEIRRTICDYPPFVSLLAQGATIEEVYLSGEGSEIGRRSVVEGDCLI